jgi:hypothetical protein
MISGRGVGGDGGRGPVGRAGRRAVGERRRRVSGGDAAPIWRLAIRARGMSKAASRGLTHVSTRLTAQTKAQFSLESDGAPTQVPLSLPQIACAASAQALILTAGGIGPCGQADQGRHTELIPRSNFLDGL